MDIIKRHQHKIIFACIILVAIFLRFYQLGNVPVSPDWDEAAIGYNAYSLLHTGKDEYGKVLPVVIESFGDFKPALYVYLTIPSILLFGLNVFAVRLPSAILGVLAVIATYYLAKELFKRRDVSLLTAFFLAISPWALQFSRVGFETSVGDDFNIFVILFFLKGLRKRGYLFLATFFAAINLYVYQSEKVFTPLLVILLIIIYHKQLFATARKTLIEVVIFGLIIAFPLVLFTLTNQNSLNRLGATSIFSGANNFLTSSSLMTTIPQEDLHDINNHDILGQVLDNRKVVLAEQVILNYVVHFNPNWWFITGDTEPRHQSPQMGHLYWWDFVFLFIGIFTIIFGKFDKKIKYLLIGWFLITPIPASITTDVPHAVRTLNFLPTFQIFIALGFITAIFWCKDHFSVRTAAIIALGCVILLIGNIAFYFNSYFVQYNYYNSADWQYGYTQLIPYLQTHQQDYKKIIISNAAPLDQSYIFFLFYLQYPPAQYQQITEQAGGHYTTDHSFSTFEFRQVSMRELDQPSAGYLYVVGANAASGSKHIIKTIDFLNGSPAIDIIKG